jgi:hypothetical protein
MADKKKAVLLVSEGAIYERGDLYDSLYGATTGDITMNLPGRAAGIRC